jgi:hypothetical protein
MVTLTDSDILTELTDQLADAMMLLHAAHSRLPSDEQALKQRMETAIREIGVLRLKIMRVILDEMVRTVLDGDST